MIGNPTAVLDEQKRREDRDRLTTRQLAIYVFGDSEEDAEIWLKAPNKWLRDRDDMTSGEGPSPNDLIQAGREDEVRRYLIQIDEGAYI